MIGTGRKLWITSLCVSNECPSSILIALYIVAYTASFVDKNSGNIVLSNFIHEAPAIPNILARANNTTITVGSDILPIAFQSLIPSSR